MTKNLPDTIGEIVSDLQQNFSETEIPDTYKCMVSLYGKTFTDLDFAIQMEYASDVASLLTPLNESVEDMQQPNKPSDAGWVAWKEEDESSCEDPYNYDANPYDYIDEFNHQQKPKNKGKPFIVAITTLDSIIPYDCKQYVLVMCVETGQFIVTAEYAWLHEQGIMKDLHDFEGLRKYLVRIGELLDQDVLIPYDPNNFR